MKYQSFKTYMTEQMQKEYSSGLILTNGELMLGCLVNSPDKHFYDLPKGGLDVGEKPIDACVRETKEGTFLDIDKDNLTYLGLFPLLRYSTVPHKHLHLYLLKMNDLPSIHGMKCTSHFVDKQGNSKPEMIGYKYFPLDDINKYMSKNMTKVLKQILHKIK